MDVAVVVAACGVAASVAATGFGAVNTAQNRRLHKQGSKIEVNVDGTLSQTRDQGVALRLEVDALKILVARLTADRDGVDPTALIREAEKAAAAAATRSSIGSPQPPPPPSQSDE